MWTFIFLTLTWCMLLTVKGIEALTCFNCQGIHHPRFCEYVKDCAEGQICSTNPNTVNGVQACFRCCSTDLCNNFGCGETDYSSNGTVCYNCQGVLQPSDCQSVTFCENYEMCYIEERSHFGEKFYHSGCKEKHICEYKFVSGPIIGRREITERRSTTQLQCCNKGLCNTADHLILPTGLSFTTTTHISTTPNLCREKQRCFNGGTCQTYNDTFYCTCAKGYIGNNCLFTDGKGTSFVVIFQEIFRGGGTSSITPKLLVASERPVHLSVYYFHNNRNQTVFADKNHPEYTLDKGVLMQNGIHNAGIQVHSNVSVIMYGLLFQQTHAVSEGFMVIPELFASTEFIIPSFTTYREYSVIAITPLFDSTIVEIIIKIQSGTVTYDGTNYSNGDKILLTLNKYKTFQLSHSSDLSGTLVKASMPVVVVSGNTLTRVSTSGVSDSDNQAFIEMVPPTNQLDHLYVIPHISTRPKSVVRVITVNATTLLIRNNNNTISKMSNSRDYVDFTHNTVSYIQSSSDVLVMMCPEELPSNKGDAFMMTIPGVNQYLQSYDFVVPTGFDSFISITVSSEEVNGLILDGQPVNFSSMFSISEGSDHFSTFSITITSGFHRIEHSKNIRFGLWVYGNHDPLDAYGYPAGIAFKSLIY